MYSVRDPMQWHDMSAYRIRKVFEIREGCVFQTMSIGMCACICDWLVLLRGAAKFGSRQYRAVSSSQRWPFTFFIDYLLSELGILSGISVDSFNGLCFVSNRPVQMFWTLRLTYSHFWKRLFLLLGEWINIHRLLLLLLLFVVTFMPFEPETMSLGYILLQILCIYHLWYM